MSGPELICSQAVTWQELASDLLVAVNRLEAASREAGPAIVVTVADGLRSLNLGWCGQDGSPVGLSEEAIEVSIPPLTAATDTARDDEAVPPNASTDRAICKVAADMLSWTKHPETFELVEHRRYWLFVRWPGEAPSLVNEYAYGLWDE